VTSAHSEAVWLFDESMSDEQIQDILMFGRSDKKAVLLAAG
jgi:hypothetical protein